MPITVMPGSGEGLNPLIQALIQREKNKAEKDRIRIAQESAALEQARFDAEQGRLRDVEQGFQIAAQLFGGGKQLTPEVASGISPQALPSVIQGLQGFQQVGGQIQGQEISNQGGRIDNAVSAETAGDRVRTIQAGATNAETEARVGVATADNRIAQSGATLADTNTRNAINAQILNGTDPVNGARALSTWVQSGLPWGQVAEAVGFKGTTSIPKDQKFVDAPSGSANTDRARAQSFLPGLLQAHARIEQLGKGDFDGDGIAERRPIRMTVLSSLQQAAGSGIMDIAINSMQDEEQQAFVQVNRSYADLYRFSLSGQQSSDTERLNMMLSVTETAGDSIETILQKSRLRQVMNEVTAARANGTMTALEGAQRGLQASLGLGDPGITAAFSSLVNQVLEESGGASVSGLPGGNSLTDVESLVDGAIR